MTRQTDDQYAVLSESGERLVSPDEGRRSRAVFSLGISNDLIYSAVREELVGAGIPPGSLVVDIGCGRGNLREALRPLGLRYTGVDMVRHEKFPSDETLVQHDLNEPGIPLAGASVDVAIACEVTPYLENLWVLFREMGRLVRPGGWVLITNPNLRSLLSHLTFILRGRFNAFQDGSAHHMVTPLLETDMIRLARDAGLGNIRVFFCGPGRIGGTHRRYPQWCFNAWPRGFSDNVGIIAQRPLS